MLTLLVCMVFTSEVVKLALTCNYNGPREVLNHELNLLKVVENVYLILSLVKIELSHFFPSDILRMDSTNGDALYVRGLCLYYEDCIDKAVQFFIQALRMAPDHEKARLACRVSDS